MFAKRLLSALLLLAGACRESDPMPFELVRRVPVDVNPYPVLTGGGSSDVIGYGSCEDDWTSTIRYQFVRHDPSDPDALASLGSVSAVGGECFSMSSTTAVIGCGSNVTAIDFTGPSLFVTPVALNLAQDHVVAEGHWLLASEATTLQLVDIDQPSTRFTFDASDPVTALLPVNGAFLAFTTTGYVHVGPDVAAPTFSNTINAEIQGFERGFIDGNGALVAGPSAILGRSRIVRLDLSTPGSPTILRSLEVEGEYFAFAWNGGSTSILAIADDRYSYEGYLVTERDARFDAEGVPLPFWMDAAPNIAAHGDRFFVLEFASGGTFFSTYRIR